MEFLREIVRYWWRWWWWPSKKEEPRMEYSIENCGLSTDQIRLARFTTNVLGLQGHAQSLTVEDLVFLCYSVGMNPPEYVIEAKLRALQLSTRSYYTFEHFLHLWRTLLENHDEEESILERAFNFFDKDGNGEISTAEFKTTMTELGNLLDEDEMNEFIELMDTNRDGVIDYGEFIRLLRSQRPMYMDLASRSSLEQKVATDDTQDDTSKQIPSIKINEQGEGQNRDENPDEDVSNIRRLSMNPAFDTDVESSGPAEMFHQDLCLEIR